MTDYPESIEMSSESMFNQAAQEGQPVTVLSIYESGYVNITNFYPGSGVLNYRYYAYCTNGSFEDYGLAYVSTSSLNQQVALRGYVNPVPAGAQSYDIDIRIEASRFSATASRYIKIRVYAIGALNISVGYRVFNLESGLERYPVDIVFGQEVIPFHSPSSTQESVSRSTNPTNAMALSAYAVAIPIENNAYAEYEGHTYPKTSVPLVCRQWSFVKDGVTVHTYSSSDVSVPVDLRTRGGTYYADFYPAVRLHLTVRPLILNEEVIHEFTLSEQDPFVLPTGNTIIANLPSSGTDWDGYVILDWAFKNESGNIISAMPNETVRLWLDTQTGYTDPFSRIVTLLGTANLTITDDVPFAVVFDPAGGEFIQDMDQPAQITASAVIDGVSDTSHIYYDGAKDVWVWWADSPSAQTAKEVSVTFNGVPLTESQGLKPPAGISRATSWAIAAPYYKSEDNLQTFTVPLKRSSIDSICQKTMYPTWVPSRSGTGQRALLTAPGYGTIDLGNIQSISETYQAKVTQIPIVVYGFTRSFCMDLGVQKDISISYIRTSPKDIDDTSGDSRDWSNAKWIEMLKNVMNRWQMRTDGNKLYVLRPVHERTDENPDADPASQFINEIDGDNCYITSLPIRYESSPQTLSGSIELSMGTLYPQQAEMQPYNVIFKRNASDPGTLVKHAGRFMNMPDALAIWGGTDITIVWRNSRWEFSGSIYNYWTGTRVTSGDTQVDFGKVIDLTKFAETSPGSRTYVFTADVTSANGSGWVVANDGPNNTETDRTYTFTITQTDSSPSAELYIGAIGGGGGGGAGRKTTQYAMNYTTGGGGGASGRYEVRRISIPFSGTTITLSAVCGHAGRGGYVTYSSTGSAGEVSSDYATGVAGGDSSISLNSNPLVMGPGGGGGEMGSKSWTTDSNYVAYGGGNPNNVTEGNNIALKMGGNGGQSGHSATAGYDFISTEDAEPATAGKAGKGGVHARLEGTSLEFCGGGGGGGGFYLGGMESSSVGQGGQGAGGIHYSPLPLPRTLSEQKGNLGAGGGGGGGRIIAEGAINSWPYDGGDGGGGWVFVCVLSGGTISGS